MLHTGQLQLLCSMGMSWEGTRSSHNFLRLAESNGTVVTLRLLFCSTVRILPFFPRDLRISFRSLAVSALCLVAKWSATSYTSFYLSLGGLLLATPQYLHFHLRSLHSLMPPAINVFDLLEPPLVPIERSFGLDLALVEPPTTVPGLSIDKTG